MMDAEEILSRMLSIPRVSPASIDALEKAVGMWRNITSATESEAEPVMKILAEAKAWCKKHGPHTIAERHLAGAIIQSRKMLSGRGV